MKFDSSHARIAPPNLGSRTFKADPHGFYARLRDKAPVFRARAGRRDAWLVTRYDDVLALVKDSRLLKKPPNATGSAPSWMPRFVRPLMRNMLDLDPPDHSRLRALVQKAFTAQRIESLRGRIEELCDRLIARLRGRSSFDLVADYALPIPLTIIAELIGIPPEDQARFRAWTRRAVSASNDLDFLMALPGIRHFLKYLRGLAQQRRDQPRDDLLSALVEVEEAGSRLTEEELLGMIFLLLVAGHETTVNLIGSGILALLERPTEMQRLIEAPSLMNSAVEELLRYTSPVDIATERYAAEPLEIAGIRIPRGGLVLAVLGSANRDERQFRDPETLDLARDPNKHLAFGFGIHYCLGAQLARLEGQIAIRAFLQHLPDRGLPRREALIWRRGLHIRGPERLVLRWPDAGHGGNAAARITPKR